MLTLERPTRDDKEYDPWDDGLEDDDLYWEALRLDAEEREAWMQMPQDEGGFDEGGV